MTIDHGILNAPLSKRGNIDAQLDAYKRNAAREERAIRKALAYETKCLRERAKAVVASMSYERVASFAEKLGTTPAQARKKLNSEAHWNPGVVLRVFGESA